MLFSFQISVFFSLGQLIVSRQENLIENKGAQDKAVILSMLQHLNNFLNVTIPELILLTRNLSYASKNIILQK